MSHAGSEVFTEIARGQVLHRARRICAHQVGNVGMIGIDRRRRAIHPREPRAEPMHGVEVRLRMDLGVLRRDREVTHDGVRSGKVRGFVDLLRQIVQVEWLRHERSPAEREH